MDRMCKNKNTKTSIKSNLDCIRKKKNLSKLCEICVVVFLLHRNFHFGLFFCVFLLNFITTFHSHSIAAF